jgi:hypothetical protein
VCVCVFKFPHPHTTALCVCVCISPMCVYVCTYVWCSVCKLIASCVDRVRCVCVQQGALVILLVFFSFFFLGFLIYFLSSALSLCTEDQSPGVPRIAPVCVCVCVCVVCARTVATVCVMCRLMKLKKGGPCSTSLNWPLRQRRQTHAGKRMHTSLMWPQQGSYISKGTPFSTSVPRATKRESGRCCARF